MAFRIGSGERVVSIGMTGVGKSTAVTDLIKRFLLDYATGRVVVIDSKPRYRATHRANGTRVNYRNWVAGDTIVDSVAVYAANQLGNAFKFTRCCILQSMYPNGDDTRDFELEATRCARWLFRQSSATRPTLFVIDEWYDLLRGALAGIADRDLLRVLRAGRERSMAAAINTQRPKSIPLATLTEASKFLIFQLEYADDVKYMRAHGPQLRLRPLGHSFVWFERLRGGLRDERLMRLRIGDTEALRPQTPKQFGAGEKRVS